MNPAFPFHVFPSKSKQKQKQKLKVEQVVNPPKHKTPPFYKFRSFVVAHPKFEKILNDQNTIEHLCLNPNAMHIIEQPEFLQKVCWSSLMKNPAAMSLLEANPNRVCHLISSNPHAEYLLCKRPELIGSWYASNNPRMINFLKTNPHQIFWPKLSMNPAAGELLWTHYKQWLDGQCKSRLLFDWVRLSENPCKEAIDLLKIFPDKIHWFGLCSNTHPDAIELLSEHLEELDFYCWTVLSFNPSALSIIERNLNKVIWCVLCKNPNPNIIPLMQANPDKIRWGSLSCNPNAISFLLENVEKINWTGALKNPNAHILFEAFPDKFQFSDSLLENPNIFTYDYDGIRNHFLSTIGTEFFQKIFHPSNCDKWIGWDL